MFWTVGGSQSLVLRTKQKTRDVLKHISVILDEKKKRVLNKPHPADPMGQGKSSSSPKSDGGKRWGAAVDQPLAQCNICSSLCLDVI